MKILDELLPGVFVIEPPCFEDLRGTFVKTFHEDAWKTIGLNFVMAEEFHSTSGANVLRGMHFQRPPNAHQKVVTCLHGSVLDVILDLRSGPNYGRSAAVELSASNRLELYIPKGVAHGFLAIEDGSLMQYKTDTVHNPASDCGIRWDSFNFDWRLSSPVMSRRDTEHPTLADFATPF